MSVGEHVEIYVDETGTVSTYRDSGIYGLGFAIVPANARTLVESELKDAGLDSIHMKDLSLSGKRKAVEAVAALQLARHRVTCGAIIRSDPKYAERFVHQVLSETVLNHAETVARLMNEKHPPNRLLNLDSMFPKAVIHARLQEIFYLATGHPIVVANHHYGNKDIVMLLSAVGEVKDHVKKLNPAAEGRLNAIDKFLDTVAESRPDINLKNEGPKKLEIRVSPSASGLFGLADMFAYLARGLADSTNIEKYNTSHELLQRLSTLSPIRFLRDEDEPVPGIIFRKI